MGVEDLTSKRNQPSKPMVYPAVIPSINGIFSFTSLAHIKTHGQLTRNTNVGNKTIRFAPEADDPVARAYRQASDRLKASIEKDNLIKYLAPERNKTLYEERLEALATDSIRGTTLDAKNYRPEEKGRDPTRNLNQLTDSGEYDCEHLSYIRGLLLHEGDEHAVRIGLRLYPTQFYVALGAVISDKNNPKEMLGGHAYIVSAATGNIIEATSKSYGYLETDIEFNTLVAGYPALTGYSLYAHAIFDFDLEIADKRAFLLKDNPNDIKTLSELRQPFFNIPTPFARDSYGEAIWQAIKIETAKAAFEQQCLKTGAVTSAEGSLPLMTEAGQVQTNPTASDECLTKAQIENQKAKISNQVKELVVRPSWKLKLPVDDVPKSKASVPKSPGDTPAAAITSPDEQPSVIR